VGTVATRDIQPGCATVRFVSMPETSAETGAVRTPVTARLRRPSRTRTEQRILEVTRELLAESGVPGLTIEGVAARSGIAKTTIYRRYRSKDELALAVLIDMVDQVASVPDLGDTRAELVRFVNGAVKILGSTLMGRVMQGLVSYLAADPAMAQAFRERAVQRRLAEARRLVDRGIERGDLRPDTDYELVHDLLFGPVYYRLLLSGAPLDRKLAQGVVAAVMSAFVSVSDAPPERRVKGTARR
jgi:AcrR family transcriptional regulator